MDRHQQTALLLTELRALMQQSGLWRGTPPSPEALASTEPFCVDTLDFDAWLQFVFLPRMQALIDLRAPLPARCAITEMAETVWQTRPDTLPVIALLRRIDAHFEQSS